MFIRGDISHFKTSIYGNDDSYENCRIAMEVCSENK